MCWVFKVDFSSVSSHCTCLLAGNGSEINNFFFLFTRSFTTLCYSADGQSILAGGLSKFVCIYNVKEQILMKKFEISCNFSLDAMEVCGCSGQFHPLLRQSFDFWM